MSGIISDNIGRSSGLVKTAAGGGATVDTWVNFNGTGTPAVVDSDNVSSITDDGTGFYTINFSVNMPDDNYAAVATAGGASSDTTGDPDNSSLAVYAVDSVKFIVRSFSNSARDSINCSVVIVR